MKTIKNIILLVMVSLSFSLFAQKNTYYTFKKDYSARDHKYIDGPTLYSPPAAVFSSLFLSGLGHIGVEEPRRAAVFMIPDLLFVSSIATGSLFCIHLYNNYTPEPIYPGDSETISAEEFFLILFYGYTVGVALPLIAITRIISAIDAAHVARVKNVAHDAMKKEQPLSFQFFPEIKQQSFAMNQKNLSYSLGVRIKF